MQTCSLHTFCRRRSTERWWVWTLYSFCLSSREVLKERTQDFDVLEEFIAILSHSVHILWYFKCAHCRRCVMCVSLVCRAFSLAWYLVVLQVLEGLRLLRQVRQRAGEGGAGGVQAGERERGVPLLRRAGFWAAAPVVTMAVNSASHPPPRLSHHYRRSPLCLLHLSCLSGTFSLSERKV